MEDKSYITKVSIPTENGGSIQKYLKDLEALHSDLFTGIGQILYRGAQDGEIIALQPVEGKILVIKNNDTENLVPNIDEFISIFEQPIKTIENSYWVTGMAKKCSEENVKVMLVGQNGNVSIE